MHWAGQARTGSGGFRQLQLRLRQDPQAQTITNLDCSGLSVDKCPVDDNLGKGPTNMQAQIPAR